MFDVNIIHWGDFDLSCARVAYISQRPILVEGSMEHEVNRKINDQELDELVRTVLAIGFVQVNAEQHHYVDPRALKDQTRDYVSQQPGGVLYHARLCKPKDVYCAIGVPKEGPLVIGITHHFSKEGLPSKNEMEDFIKYCVIDKVLHRAGFTPLESRRDNIPPQFLKGGL